MSGTLEFDYDEATPDGRYVIRRVTCGDGVRKVARGVMVAGNMFDWYVSLRGEDRWLRYGHTSQPMPDNRYMPLQGDASFARVREALGVAGVPWEQLAQPEATIEQLADQYGGAAVMIVDGETVRVHRSGDEA